jgi:molybdopterin/thiamine biosynthesis adenylyltransferase
MPRKDTVVVRMAEPEAEALLQLLFRRYPHAEWVTFARFGWRQAGETLVLTLAAIDAPLDGDLDARVLHVAIDEAYTLRTALAADEHPLAVGVIHSHPEGCEPGPSSIDDDMDAYYARYYADFAPGRPYVSLIASRIDDELVMSGRIWWGGAWLGARRIIAERRPLRTWTPRTTGFIDPPLRPRTARLTAAFGTAAEHRLRAATVAVIGAGGTGSAAIEVLARAGVGHLIIVDPDHVDDSNLERLHGSTPRDAEQQPAKASVAARHVASIDPTCRVTAVVGALPQADIVDAVIQADVAIGCTDQQHSRLALADLTVRYLVPSIDCGVTLEGRDGAVRGQIVQLVRSLPADPCPYCREMIDPVRVMQELMSPEDSAARRAAAREAQARGESGNPYWHDLPQLNTVGYLTTTAGALAAGYAIGWITDRFTTPFARLQMNLVAPFLDVTDVDGAPDPTCACRRSRGWADQSAADAFITPPAHWPPAQWVSRRHR